MTDFSTVLSTLGYTTPLQQRTFIKLLHFTGCFDKAGTTPSEKQFLTDAQADDILTNIANYAHNTVAAETFQKHSKKIGGNTNLPLDTTQGLLTWLMLVTQEKMLRGTGKELWELSDPSVLEQNFNHFKQLFTELGYLTDVKPIGKEYDHALILGASEGPVEQRLNYLKTLWDAGIRFKAIYLLGGQRILNPVLDTKSLDLIQELGKGATEMVMMEKLFARIQQSWPEDLKAIPCFSVDAPMQPNPTATPEQIAANPEAAFRRPNTEDTLVLWDTLFGQAFSKILAITTQPFVQYQGQMVKAILSSRHQVETVGAGVDMAIEAKRFSGVVSIGLDAIARPIYAGYELIQKKLAALDAAKTPVLPADKNNWVLRVGYTKDGKEQSWEQKIEALNGLSFSKAI